MTFIIFCEPKLVFIEVKKIFEASIKLLIKKNLFE
jgi:hypothetical protein